MNKPAIAIDGRQIAHENEIRVLRAIHRYGWLRTRDLAVLVWRERSRRAPKAGPSLVPYMPSHSELRMAQRTVARLRSKRYILTSGAPNGSQIHALSEKGAWALQSIDVPAATGKDLIRTFSSSHFKHRCIANEIAISGFLEGFSSVSEREISQGRWLGGIDGILGKKPDVLLTSGNRAWWIEVERSRKNHPEYLNLLKWLYRLWQHTPRLGDLAPLTGEIGLVRVTFICTEAFHNRLAADLLAMGWTPEQLVTRVYFEKTLYTMKGISFF